MAPLVTVSRTSRHGRPAAYLAAGGGRAGGAVVLASWSPRSRQLTAVSGGALLCVVSGIGDSEGERWSVLGAERVCESRARVERERTRSGFSEETPRETTGAETGESRKRRTRRHAAAPAPCLLGSFSAAGRVSLSLGEPRSEAPRRAGTEITA